MESPLYSHKTLNQFKCLGHAQLDYSPIATWLCKLQMKQTADLFLIHSLLDRGP